MPHMWTERTVEFVPYPGTDRDAWDRLFDALPDRYWTRPAWVRRFLELGFSASGLTIEVVRWPVWYPAWLARRVIVNLAVEHGVGGEATYVVKRVSLL